MALARGPIRDVPSYVFGFSELRAPRHPRVPQIGVPRAWGTRSSGLQRNGQLPTGVRRRRGAAQRSVDNFLHKNAIPERLISTFTPPGWPAQRAPRFRLSDCCQMGLRELEAVTLFTAEAAHADLPAAATGERNRGKPLKVTSSSEVLLGKAVMDRRED